MAVAQPSARSWTAPNLALDLELLRHAPNANEAAARQCFDDTPLRLLRLRVGSQERAALTSLQVERCQKAVVSRADC